VVILRAVVNLIAQTALPEVSRELTTEEKVRLNQLEIEVEKNLTGFR
jgi:hypothetical protein